MATGASYPFEATDQNGVERLAGTLTFTDDTDQPAGATTGLVAYGDGAALVTIGNGADAPLSFETDGGDALLSYTTPTAPTVISAGTYAITVTAAAATDVTAGGAFGVLLEAGDTARAQAQSPPATAAAPQPYVSLSLTVPLAAGDVIALTVSNTTGASEDFVADRLVVTKIA